GGNGVGKTTLLEAVQRTLAGVESNARLVARLEPIERLAEAHAARLESQDPCYRLSCDLIVRLGMATRGAGGWEVGPDAPSHAFLLGMEEDWRLFWRKRSTDHD